uniref:Uncharacterized protein n=1 Tax=Oryza rufipogon TaxID=4529 RepID=A0A0E0NXP7_ORYRU
MASLNTTNSTVVLPPLSRCRSPGCRCRRNLPNPLYLATAATRPCERFININMNVENARMTYIMKRREYQI